VSEIESRQHLQCASLSLSGSRTVGIRRTSRSTVAMSRPTAQDLSPPQEVCQLFCPAAAMLIYCRRWPCADLVHRSDIQRGGSQLHQAEAACFDELPFRHNPYRTLLAQWQVLGVRGRRQNRMRLYSRSKSAIPFSYIWCVRRARLPSGWNLTCGCRQQRSPASRKLANIPKTHWP